MTLVIKSQKFVRVDKMCFRFSKKILQASIAEQNQIVLYIIDVKLWLVLRLFLRKQSSSFHIFFGGTYHLCLYFIQNWMFVLV